MLLPNAIFISGIPSGILVNVEDACLNISVRTVAKVILVAIKLQPLIAHPLAGPAIVRTAIVLHKVAANQFVIAEYIIVSVDLLVSINRLEDFRAEIVVGTAAVCIRQVPPARLGHTVDGVVPCAIKLEQACDLTLAGAGRLVEAIVILVGCIVDTRDLVYALQGIVVNEVVECTVDRLPSGPCAVVQDELVREILIRLAVEVAALWVDNVFRLLIGIDAVLLLEGGLAGHTVQCIRAQIDVITNGTGVRDGQRLIRIPRRVILGGHFHTAEDTDGVGGVGRDRLTLLDEVALDGEDVVFIQHRRGQSEIIVRHRQTANVHIDVLVKPERHGHLGFRADALRQLKQQIPRRDIGNIAARHHRQQRLQLFGHLDGRHIQSEDIGDIHRLAGLHHMVAIQRIVVAGDILRIGDISCPCEGSVAACGVVKVENRLIGTVHGDLNRSTDRVVPRNHGRDGHVAQTGLLTAGKGKAIVRSFHSTCCAVAQFKCDIARAHSDGILVIGCNQRKAHRVSVNGVDARFGEFQAIRLDHGKRLAANHRVTGQELNFHAAFLDGGENTIFRDGTDGFIRGLPCDIGREFRRAAGHTDTGSDQADCGAARQVIISRGDQGMIKLRRDRGRGDHHQRGTNGTLITIRRTVHNRERIAAFLLRYEGSGTAAIQVDCGHTACVQHDLCQFFSTAASGEGFLTTVQHHHDDLALSSDTHTSAGMTAVIIVCCAGHDGLSILDQINAATDSLLDLVFIGCVIAGAADHGGSILQNRKEVFRGDTVIFDTLHDQSTAGGTGGHVVEACIDTDHRVVVLHIVRCVGRIRVTLLCRSHLVGYAGHGPALARIVGVVVGVNTYVLAGNIHGGDIVHDLLFVGGQCIVDRLGHAGCDSRRIRGEHRIVLVVRFGLRIRLGLRGRTNGVGAVGIARQVKQIVCKGVAARLAQRLTVGKIRQRVGALQRTDQGVVLVDIQHRAADTFLGDHTAQTVGQEIGSACSLRKVGGKIRLNDLAQRFVALVHLRCEIKGVQIAVKIRFREGVIHLVQRVVIHTEVFCTNVGSQNVNVRLRGIHLVGDVHILSAEHHVRDVTGPAAHVGTGLHHGGRHPLHLGIIGHVHCAEHMAQVNQVSVGQRELLQILQRGSGGSICSVLLGHIFREGCILRAGQCCPGAGSVPFHACADEIDHQRSSILRGIALDILGSVILQLLEVSKECGIVGYWSQVQRDNRLIRVFLLCGGGFRFGRNALVAVSRIVQFNGSICTSGTVLWVIGGVHISGLIAKLGKVGGFVHINLVRDDSRRF